MKGSVNDVTKEERKRKKKKKKKEKRKKEKRREFFFFKQKTAYEIKECDWSSDVCSSDLVVSIIRQDDGNDTMTFDFDAPENTGEYIIQITLSDRAGNQHTYQSKFDFVDEPANVLPELASVDPPDRSLVNALTQATAVLIDNS